MGCFLAYVKLYDNRLGIDFAMNPLSGEPFFGLCLAFSQNDLFEKVEPQ